MNGLLLGSKTSEKSKTEVVDAVPLFHQCLYVTPMSEVAFVQVEARAIREGLKIIGYYAAAENFYDNTIDKAPGIKMAEKIVENNGSACVIMVSCTTFTSRNFLTVFKLPDGQQIDLHGHEAFRLKSLAVERREVGERQAHGQRLAAHA